MLEISSHNPTNDSVYSPNMQKHFANKFRYNLEPLPFENNFQPET